MPAGRLFHPDGDSHTTLRILCPGNVYMSTRLNLSLTNILNNTDLRTGGFEQNRDDNYKDGDARVYKFSKNSKYFYAFPFNAFLNIGYRF